MWIVTTENELCHYGVPGMKWGQRRALKKMMRWEKKQMRYQDKADYQNTMRTNSIKVKTTVASTAKDKFGKVGVANRVSYAATKSAYKTATKRGAKAVKAQMKADKWKRKIDKMADKKKIDKGSSTVAEYMLRKVNG